MAWRNFPTKIYNLTPPGYIISIDTLGHVSFVRDDSIRVELELDALDGADLNQVKKEKWIRFIFTPKPDLDKRIGRKKVIKPYPPIFKYDTTDSIEWMPPNTITVQVDSIYIPLRMNDSTPLSANDSSYIAFHDEAAVPSSIAAWFECQEMNHSRQINEPWQGTVRIGNQRFDCRKWWENSRHAGIRVLGADESFVDTLKF